MGARKKKSGASTANTLLLFELYFWYVMFYTSSERVVLATVNILQGSIIGSLGKITGSVWKGKPTIRARIFSKAPATNLQTASVRAFEKLNRIASAIAFDGFSHLGLSSKGLHKHNAVAKWLKPAVAHNTFNPANIANVIPFGNNVRLTTFKHLHWSGETFIKFQLVQGFVVPDFSYLHFVVFDDNGNTVFSHCDLLKNYETSFFVDTFGKEVFSVLAFVTTPNRHKRIANNLIYQRGNIMRYSFEEQLTGDIYFDGRPIYVKSYKFNAPVDNIGNFLQRIPARELINLHIIKSEMLEITDADEKYYSYASNILHYTPSPTSWVPQSLSVAHFMANTDEGELLIRGRSIFDNGWIDIIVAVYYTKPSDPPVVDG
jgi:hypothetical protein